MQLKLYDLRKNYKHMTQEEVAKYLGITAKTYRDKEKASILLLKMKCLL